MTRANHDEHGFATMQYVVASALSLLLFVLLANLLVDLYERGAVRDALDDGVRAEVPAAARPGECVARARAVVRSIAAGAAVRIDRLECHRTDDEVRAVAHLTLRSWLPMLVPDWHLALHARATREH